MWQVSGMQVVNGVALQGKRFRSKWIAKWRCPSHQSEESMESNLHRTLVAILFLVAVAFGSWSGVLNAQEQRNQPHNFRDLDHTNARIL